MGDPSVYSRQYDDPSFPSEYIEACCTPIPWVRFEGDDDCHKWFIKEIYNVFQQLPDGLEKLLDFGAGPSIINTYLAASKFKEITLAEYADANREELQKWHNGDQDQDSDIWKKTLENLMSYAGIKFIPETYEKLRSMVTQILPCDLVHDPVLPMDVVKRASQDCIVTTLALEAGATTTDAFNKAVKGLATFLKPGGYLILGTVLDHSYYTVGKERFQTLKISEDQVLKFARDARLKCGEPKVFKFSGPIPEGKTRLSDAEGCLVVCCRLEDEK